MSCLTYVSNAKRRRFDLICDVEVCMTAAAKERTNLVASLSDLRRDERDLRKTIALIEWVEIDRSLLKTLLNVSVNRCRFDVEVGSRFKDAMLHILWFYLSSQNVDSRPLLESEHSAVLVDSLIPDSHATRRALRDLF